MSNRTHPYMECPLADRNSYSGECDECERYYWTVIHPDFCEPGCSQRWEEDDKATGVYDSGKCRGCTCQHCIIIDIRNAYRYEEFTWPALDEWRELLGLVEHRPEFKEGLPDGEFRIFRGGTPEGFSWTLDEDTAIWFATRFQRIGIIDNVYAMNVTKNEVLWYTNERSEQEVVLLPDADKVELVHDFKAKGVTYGNRKS